MLRLGAFGPPHDPGPTPQEIRNRQLEQARRAGWPQLDCHDVVHRRYGVVEDAATGTLYQLHRGELVDVLYTSATAYYLNERNEVVFLQDLPPGSPRTVEELQQRQAEREQRHNAPKPRPQAAP